jgi:hypothetical protein
MFSRTQVQHYKIFLKNYYTNLSQPEYEVADGGNPFAISRDGPSPM